MDVKFSEPGTYELLRSDASFEINAIQTTGSIGYVEFRIDDTDGTAIVQTPEVKLFTDTYKHITLQRVLNENETSASYDLYLKEAVDERLRIDVTGSVQRPIASKWGSPANPLIIGSTLSGSIDEFRLWKLPLEESAITNHAKYPDAIDGNSYKASTEDLWFRLNFEIPKNHGTDDTIKNVAISDVYGEEFATASNFESITKYPYNYTTYNRTVSTRVPSLGYSFSNKIRFEEQELVSDLSHKVRATKKAFDRAPVDSPRLGLFFSLNKELNLDIVRSFGDFNIDNFIGDPSDRYENDYSELKTLREYYFQRITRNYQEYIQLVRYIDKSLFDTLENLVPSRAKLSKGLLIEPHILERSKVRWNRPESEKNDYETVIDFMDTTNIEFDYDVYEGVIDYEDESELSGRYEVYEGLIDEGDDLSIESDYEVLNALVNYNDITSISGSTPFYEVNIDAPIGNRLEALNIPQVQSDFTQVGFDLEEGFGLYALDSHGKVTTVDSKGNRVSGRSQIYQIREYYNINLSNSVFTGGVWNDDAFWDDSDEWIDEVTVGSTRYVITTLPFGAAPPSVGGDILEVTPLNGYFPSHYKFKANLSEGLQRSYYKGSKQTADTTPDGLPPVQTFTTNPNILRVADTGRGAGEPILIVNE